MVTRLTRNEKIIGSIPILGIESSFGDESYFLDVTKMYYSTDLIKLYNFACKGLNAKI